MVLSNLTNRFATFETGNTRKKKSPRACLDCGTRVGSNGKRCPPCSYEHVQQRAKERYRAKHPRVEGERVTPAKLPKLERPPKRGRVHNESVRDLGMACRAAGITLKDIALLTKLRLEAT